MQIVVLAGLPGSGKSTLASHLCAALGGAALVDKDTLEWPLVNAALKLACASPDDPESELYVTELKMLSYETMERVAEQNAEAGNSVVLVAPFSSHVQDASWPSRLSQRCSGATVQVVWLVADAAELHKRKTARSAARDRATEANATQPKRPVPKIPHRLVDTSQVAFGHMHKLAATLATELRCSDAEAIGANRARAARVRSSLRLWLLIVAGLRSLSVVLALLWPDVLARSVFAAAPQALTALGAHVFACWTLMTCCLCVLCAKEGADPSTSTFAATAFSFVTALGLFVPELVFHRTMTLRSAASPMIIASTSLVWMAVVRWPGRGASYWMIAVAGMAAIVVTVAMGLDAHRLGFPDRLDASHTWDEESARTLLVQLGASGRAAYRDMYLAPLGDLALPLCYAPALAALCWRCFPDSRAYAAALPLLAGACDLLENVSILTLLESYPKWSEASQQLALRAGPWATRGKWIMLASTLAVLVRRALTGSVIDRQREKV